MRLTIEEALTQLEGKAALLRYLASSATVNPEQPDRTVLAGMGDLCGELEELARLARRSLDPELLGVELKAGRRP